MAAALSSDTHATEAAEFSNAPSIASRMSATSCIRCFGSFSKQRRKNAMNTGGRFFGSTDVPVRIDGNDVSQGVPLTNASRPLERLNESCESQGMTANVLAGASAGVARGRRRASGRPAFEAGRTTWPSGRDDFHRIVTARISILRHRNRFRRAGPPPKAGARRQRRRGALHPLR